MTGVVHQLTAIQILVKSFLCREERLMAIQEIEFYVPIKYNPYVEERYEVSTLGHIRNRKTGHVLINQQRRQNGYASICLQIGDGKQVTFYVHILVLLHIRAAPALERIYLFHTIL